MNKAFYQRNNLIVEAYRTDTEIFVEVCYSKEIAKAHPGDWILTDKSGRQYIFLPEAFEGEFEKL
jgi:hypothetical protein